MIMQTKARFGLDRVMAVGNRGPAPDPRGPQTGRAGLGYRAQRAEVPRAGQGRPAAIIAVRRSRPG
jgi:hypothetical protein